MVDLAGGTLLPGFIDAHAHPVAAGEQLRRCDLTAARSLPEYLDIIAEYARSHPGESWITGGGWSMEAFPGGMPTAGPLDSLVPDRPVFLPNRDGHGAWVNSRALILAGIDASTPDPADGRIERDAGGNPAGMLQEGAAGLVSRLIPAATEDDRYEALLAAQEYLLPLGITGWQDAIVGRSQGHGDPIPAYLRAARDGTLLATVVGALWWDRHRGLEQLDELIEQAQRSPRRPVPRDQREDDARRRRREPHRRDARALPRRPRLRHKRQRPRLHRSRRAAALRHRAGPGRIPGALPCARRPRRPQRARRRRRPPARPTATPGTGTTWPTCRSCTRTTSRGSRSCPPPPTSSRCGPRTSRRWTELTIPFLGDRRAAWQYPFRSLQEAGAALCAGSDWPVSSPNPLWGAHVAVNRIAPAGDGGGDAGPFLPGERLSLTAILAAYTSGSARINGLDSVTGAVRAGLDADFAVVDADLRHITSTDIGQASVTQTWIRGELAWPRAPRA